jgi:hypothetical protein
MPLNASLAVVVERLLAGTEEGRAMKLMQLLKQTTPQLIAPECSAPGCHRAGDRYTMVKCSACGQWYCDAHLAFTLDGSAPDEPGEPTVRIAQVPTIKLTDASPNGPTYYVGYCASCLAAPAARATNDSSWLR